MPVSQKLPFQGQGHLRLGHNPSLTAECFPGDPRCYVNADFYCCGHGKRLTTPAGKGFEAKPPPPPLISDQKLQPCLPHPALRVMPGAPRWQSHHRDPALAGHCQLLLTPAVVQGGRGRIGEGGGGVGGGGGGGKGREEAQRTPYQDKLCTDVKTQEHLY